MLAAMVQELTHELGELQVQLMTGMDEDDGEFLPDEFDEDTDSRAPASNDETDPDNRTVRLITSMENKRRYKKDLIFKIQNLIQQFNLRGENIDKLLRWSGVKSLRKDQCREVAQTLCTTAEMEVATRYNVATLKAFVTAKLNEADRSAVEVAFNAITQIKSRPPPAPRPRAAAGAPGGLPAGSTDNPSTTAVPQAQSAPLNPLPATQSTMQASNIMTPHESAP